MSSTKLNYFIFVIKFNGFSYFNTKTHLVRTSFDCHSECLSKLINSAAISWKIKWTKKKGKQNKTSVTCVRYKFGIRNEYGVGKKTATLVH